MAVLLEQYRSRQDTTHTIDYKKPRHLYPVEAESVPPPALALEVKKIRQDPQKETLYMLPKTGFHVEGQANLLLDNLRFKVPIEKSFQQIEQDIQGFKTEYLVEGPVFPIVLEKVKRDGKTRIAGKLYGERLWLDATDEKERDGAVKQSVAEMEEILVNAEPGTTVVMISPEGWSGYKDIRYPDSQLYAITVLPDGSLRGFTLKTHMSLSQNEALLGQYSARDPHAPQDINPKNRIKEVVRTVVKFSPEDNKSIEDIAQDVSHIMENEVAYLDSSKKKRTFSEMMHILKNPEPLWTLDETTKKLVDELKEYVSYRVQNPDQQMKRDIEVAMGHTVLRLMHAIRPAERAAEMNSGISYDVSKNNVPLFNPQETLNEMQKIAGCAGGGTIKTDSITPRAAVLGAEDQYGSLEFICPDCHMLNKRPTGVLLSRCQNNFCQSTNVGCKEEPVSLSAKRQEKNEPQKQEKKAA